MAARHIGHGSQEVKSTQSVNTWVLKKCAASRMASISACAVGSQFAVTRFTPVPTIYPFRTTTAPNGPPPFRTLLVARSIAKRINFSIVSSCMGFRFNFSQNYGLGAQQPRSLSPCYVLASIPRRYENSDRPQKGSDTATRVLLAAHHQYPLV